MKLTLEKIISFFRSQRATGTTTLIKKIAKDNDVWLLMPTAASKGNFKDIKNVLSLSDNLDGLPPKPILVDNHTMLFIAEMTVGTIDTLTSSLHEEKQKSRNQQVLIDNLNQQIKVLESRMPIDNTTKTPHPEWLMGGNPNAIEEQEKQGQDQITRAREVMQLPIKVNYPLGEDGKKGNSGEAYEAMGIKVIGTSKGDELFFDVHLPAGWNINPTDHPMWSTLVDSEGKERANIFYKAAFYDRDAFVNFK